MKRVLVFLLLIMFPAFIFAAAELAGTTSNNFIKIAPMAGAAAMADAYTAVSEGTYGIYYNPAGISYIISSELQASHVSWFQGINAEHLCLVLPFAPVDSAKIGFGFLWFDAGTVDATVSLPSYDSPYLNSGLNYDSFVQRKLHPYSYSVAGVYAMNIREFLSAGVRIKYNTEYIGTSSGANLASDIGFLYKMDISGHLVGFGVTLSNLGTELKMDRKGYAPPKIADIGASDRFDLPLGNLLVSAQFSIHVDYDFIYMLGAEYRMFDIAAIRLGYMFGGYSNLTAGCGIKLGQTEVNYSFVNYADLGQVHRISLVYAWGSPPVGMTLKPAVFSPNGDGFTDKVEFTPRLKYTEKIRSTYINIHKKGAKQALAVLPVDAYSNTPAVFDGRVSDAELPDGEYEAVLAAEYKGGRSLSKRQLFEVDNTPPDLFIDGVPKLLKPEGESLVIPATFTMSGKDRNGIAYWQLIVWNKDKKVFYTTGASGAPPETFIWDGKGNDGTYVVTGEIYYYSLSARDKLGNRSQTEPKPQVVLLKEIKLTFSSDALFEAGNANVRITAYGALKGIKPVLDKHPDSEIMIAGYTDNSEGSDNTALSKARAEAVKFFMVNLLGYNEKMIDTAGFGENFPITDNSTPEGRLKNRRVEITIKSTIYK